MAIYVSLEFQCNSTEQAELLLAELSNIGFEGFEEEKNILRAYIPANDFNEEAVKALAGKYAVSYNKTIIEETNWNHLWESNFQPVIVDNFVAIRAHFHEPIGGVEHEIVITPKMSFGTGHHATTLMMIRQMHLLNFKGKTVLDFGTGTGILSVLAEKLGAAAITAIDNDEWSITNATENLERNGCRLVKIEKADGAGYAKQYDIILANINKNVIIDNLPSMVNQLAPGGILMLSGLLATDEEVIRNNTNKFSLKPGIKMGIDNWISLVFSH